MKDFSKLKIKEYAYWGIYIHENQGYLGRCVVWCNREDALDLVGATPEEREELFIILKELRDALIKSFKPDWFNYSFLGNETRHLHGHLIPRYSSERRLANLTFIDKEWGHNYRTDHKFIISEKAVQQIKEKIKENIFFLEHDLWHF